MVIDLVWIFLGGVIGWVFNWGSRLGENVFLAGGFIGVIRRIRIRFGLAFWWAMAF